MCKTSALNLENQSPDVRAAPIISLRTKCRYSVQLIFEMPQMPMLLLLMWEKEQCGCQVVSLNFPTVPGGGGMREGMPGAWSPSLERGQAGAVGGLCQMCAQTSVCSFSSGGVTGAGLAVRAQLQQCIVAPPAPSLGGFCMESPDGGISFFTQWVLINILGNAITGSQVVETSGFPTLGQYGHRPWLSFH